MGLSPAGNRLLQYLSRSLTLVAIVAIASADVAVGSFYLTLASVPSNVHVRRSKADPWRSILVEPDCVRLPLLDATAANTAGMVGKSTPRFVSSLLLPRDSLHSIIPSLPTILSHATS